MLSYNQISIKDGLGYAELVAEINRLRKKIAFLDRTIEVLHIKIDSRKGKTIPKKTRALILARSSGLCERCGLAAEHIHHINKDRKNHSLDNLIHLCIACHEKEHKRTIPNVNKLTQ